MVGKDPYYDDTGVLQIDDIYLMGASVSPVGRAEIKAAVSAVIDGLSFTERWRANKEHVQKVELKTCRAFHKTLILALGYGQGAKGMTYNARDNGYVLSLSDAKAFHKAYWEVLFPGLTKLQLQLQARFKRSGCLINEFGYRMVPEHERLCLNFWIQSSVSGIMKVLETKFFAIADYTHFVSCIHDEIVMQVPTERLGEAKAAMDAAVASLNSDLNWSVKVRTGWAIGKDLYECK